MSRDKLAHIWRGELSVYFLIFTYVYLFVLKLRNRNQGRTKNVSKKLAAGNQKSKFQVYLC